MGASPATSWVGTVRKWAGGVVAVAGVLTLLSAIPVAVTYEDSELTALVGLAGTLIVLAGVHLFYGIKRWRWAAIADGAGILYGSRIAFDIIGHWVWFFVPVGLAVIIATVFTWPMEPENN